MSEDEPMPIETYAVTVAHILVHRRGPESIADILGRLNVSGEQFHRAEQYWTTKLAECLPQRKGLLAMTFAAAYAKARVEVGLIDAGGAAMPAGPPAIAVPTYLRKQEPVEAPPAAPPASSPAAPPAAPEPVRGSSLTGTVAAPEVAPGPATPFQSAVPDSSGFTVSQYARLCAELVKSDDRNQTRAAHNLDATTHAALDAHWRGRMREDAPLRSAFERAYAEHLRDLERPPEPPAQPASGSRTTAAMNLSDPNFAEAALPMPLDRYAALCKELEQRTAAPATVLVRHGFKNTDEYRRLDASMRQAIEQNPELKARYQRLRNQDAR
jgi:hypothetical protein